MGRMESVKLRKRVEDVKSMKGTIKMEKVAMKMLAIT